MNGKRICLLFLVECANVCGTMYTASSILCKARTFYIPKGYKRERTKIFVFGKKKNRYYHGDRTEYWNQYLKSDHWKTLRTAKLFQTPACEKCGNNSRLDIHHINYKNLYDVELSDLMTLCRKCHVEIHKPPVPKPRKKKKKRKIRNVFRHRKSLIRKVSKITNMDSHTIEKFLNKMNSRR